MFTRGIIQNTEDYFKELNQRPDKCIYFYRMNGYNDKCRQFIGEYAKEARKSGVVIEGKIANPTEQNLSYYEEIMGMDFQMSMGFLLTSLKKWLPRMNDYQRENVAAAFYDTLDAMRKEGKNENMLKNAYIKFMCWFYYKFERMVNNLGENNVPKILYEGTISNYELKILDILAGAGCDILLLQYQGDATYQKLDAGSKISKELVLENMQPFPEGFSLKNLREDMEKEKDKVRLYGTLPTVHACTNAWIHGEGLEDFKMAAHLRGEDTGFFYNCFCRMTGVEDKLTYLNELYQFRLELKNSGRNMLILEREIPVPTMEEISAIRRNTYNNVEQMLFDLSVNIKYSQNIELQRLMNQAFIDIMLEELEISGMNVNRLTNKAVYLLCWLKRYQKELFEGWEMPKIGCFIYLGGCRNENEALFVRMLARLPVDVLILNPNQDTACCLSDKLLYEIHYTESLAVEHFPNEGREVQMGTAAYHAERELDTIMYQDSGIYRNQQYGKANAVMLRTMYEEIPILWDQEVKYRPNFSVTDSVVNIPVIFAKVSGVKDGQLAPYWSGIKSLMTEETYVISKAPFIESTDANPIKAHVTEFYKNNRLQREKIKSHPVYRYGVLREEMQDYILDKLGLLIAQKTIRGTGENGTEYTIISTVLNMNKDIIRMIQKFDFTKKNPKLIYINTTETVISLEDSILTAFLSLLGFDVVFFVPTGYQSVEKYFNTKVMEEHQIGEYLYDLQVPNFELIPSGTRQSWRDRLFKRGG